MITKWTKSDQLIDTRINQTIDETEQMINEIDVTTQINSVTGDLSSLATTDKLSLVAAINEVNNFNVLSDAKNSIYRGKNLGSVYTADQQSEVSAGTFNDLFVGDYWEVDGIKYRIAGFNCFKNVGSVATDINRLVIVPDRSLYQHKINDTNTTSGGYAGSNMRSEGLEQAKTIVESIFNNKILNQQEMLVNTVNNGMSTGRAWFDSEMELLNEIMLFGCSIFAKSSVGISGLAVGSAYYQLPLFRLNPNLIASGDSFWIRDIANDTAFVRLASDGVVTYSSTSLTLGVRPYFSIY